jgi:hypothetical protein
MVLAFRDNHQAATTIPAGRTIEVLGLAEDDRFSVIRSEGEEFLVFETDLLERGSLVMQKAAGSERRGLRRWA